MANPYDQFDAQSEVKDLATSFGVGSNQLLKMAGDVYGLASGNMDNVVSRQGQENIDNFQRGKSQKLVQSETRRKAAVDMEEGTLNKALAYVRETFTDPRLFLSTTVEALPSMVGAGAVGAGARVATGKVLAKMGAEKAAETATKVGVGTAVAAAAGGAGASVGADQYKEIVELLSNMPEDQALKVPQIVQLVVEKNATLEEAKTALALDLARSTGALATIASAGTQMLPGGRTIEKALVGGAGKKIAGSALTRAGVGAIGEGAQEAVEGASGEGVKNLLARAVDPEREITKGMGEAAGAGFAGAGPIGAVAGAASRPSRPVLASETTAGMSSEPLASDAIPSETRTSTTDTPDLSLEGAAEMNTQEVGSVLSARESSARGFTPDPSDIATAESVRRPQIEVSEEAAKEANAPVQEALDEWRTQNPDVGLSVTVINDPNMRNTRNYGIRGYFDPNTGEVVINSAFTKPFEVESVVNHEWSHHTLSSEEGRAALVEFATRDIPKEELDALAKRYPNADNLTLVEEWIARNQEKSPGTFARIIAKIREWLNGKLGINMTNEEVARVMLRTLRERGAPVAEGSGEMRQSTTDDPVGIPERRAEALRSFKERNPLSDATMESGRLYSPKVRDRLKTLSSTGVVDRAALDSDIETNFPVASRVEIPTEETLPTLDEIRNAVDEPKRSKVGGANNIPEGDLIVVRQEVPSYTRYGVGVVVVRDSKGNTYYQPMVRFTDPVLKPTPREENTALRIGSGEGKIPTITVEGRMTSDQSMPPDLDTWTQVGYNPDRHSYMYDRETGDPVLSGSEAVQIGNTVFVKDPEFGQRKDFKYSVEDELLDTASENLNKTPNEATSIQQEDTRPARALPKSRFYVSSDERGGDFAGAIAEAARLHKKGAAVEVKSPEFYSDPENHLYFSEDGLAGAVVKPDGDLVSVFKHPDSTAKMRDILTDASQEATKLDGFDIDEFLPNYYSRFGFRPVARVTFNDDFAPPKWNFEENGRPDNVFMVRDPENKLGLPEYDAYSEVRDSVPLVSYEEALRIQQEAVDKVASEKPSVSEQSNVLAKQPIRESVTEDPVDVADLPKNLRGDSEGFIPTYITKQNALPTVVVGKNKTVEIPVIDFSQYADKVFKAKGTSELKGKNITLADAHVPVIQKYYAGLSPETYREKDVRAAADMVANDMSNNLLFLHDLALDTFGPEVVKRMSKWYDGANVIAKKFADEYGVSIEQSAAILATLSPQKHWFANVSLAENVMDVMRNHQDTVFDAAVEKAARASIKNSVGTTSSKRVLYEYIRAISGKKLSDLNILEEKTVFTRFLSQSIHPKLAYVVTPEGKLTPGSSVAVAWSGIPISANSVNAFLDGSVNNLTVALGGGHKVRDFYGNIVDPMSPFFYTSDTHNVAASLLLPVGGTDFEVSHNFGGNPGVGEGPKLPVIGTTVTGLQGTYPLYLEAGRRAAEQRNVLPRQMQSITWEMIRIMFTDDMKTPAFMDSVRRVHDQVRSGGLDIDSARQNIIELSGGRDAIKARPPEWLNK